MTAREAHALVRSAPNSAAAMDAVEAAVAAGITGAELLDAASCSPSCPRCGQTMIADATVCEPCRQLDREPQGERLALFTVTCPLCIDGSACGEMTRVPDCPLTTPGGLF